MYISTIFALIILGLLFFYFISKEIIEVNFLKKTLFLIIDKKKIESREDLIKIKNYLQKNISFDGKLKNKRRPFLRHTATEILRSNYGFCGENSRVAIKLFKIGGVKSNRVYLFRKEWEHVLIEHKMNNEWFMFDGHYDESTILKDKDVATIKTKDISLYPDEYPNNPYLDYCRIKLIYKLGIFKSLSKLRLPSVLSYGLESPKLILACFVLLLILTGIIVLPSI
jgi:hypothetical protein